MWLTDIILHFLVELYRLTGNLGVAIIVFTLIIRFVLVPLSWNSLKAAKKMKEIQPELKELRQKHKEDKTARQQAEMELYKKYNINPLAGCLPQVVQIALLIILYRVLLRFLGQSELEGITINPEFLWLNLSRPDQLYVLPFLAGFTQLILSLMILPGGETADIVPNKSSDEKTQTANKKEEDFAEMAATMQKQMLFIMPVMTGFIALQFPAGLTLYWVVTTVFSIAQQWILSGPGGLITYPRRMYRTYVSRKTSETNTNTSPVVALETSTSKTASTPKPSLKSQPKRKTKSKTKKSKKKSSKKRSK